MDLENRLIRDVCCFNDINREYLLEIAKRTLDIRGEMMSRNPHRFRSYLDSFDATLLFSEVSTRTYGSFEKALQNLGVRNIGGFRDPSHSSLKKGETLFDTIDTHCGYGGDKIIVIRDPRQGSGRWAQISAFRAYQKRVMEFVQQSGEFPKNLILPVVFSGGDGKRSHLTQLIDDAAAMCNLFGRIQGLDIGIINDIGASRVASSYIDAAPMLDWTLHICPLPGASLNPNQIYSALTHGSKVKLYSSVPELFENVDLVYVNRFQFNLRGGETGKGKCDFFTPDHPRITRDIVDTFKVPIFHAKPVDKNAKEIGDDIRDHPLNYSNIQSDFGLYGRMAMIMYAIDNRMYDLDQIIKTLSPEDLGYFRQRLLTHSVKTIDTDRYTTALVRDGYAIDHIPNGCEGVMHNLIRKILPDYVQIVTSSNVKGDYDNSISKGVIKMHAPANWELPEDVGRIAVLFTDSTAKKSCRFSKLRDYHVIEKWQWRQCEEKDSDSCGNPECIRNDEHAETIYSKNKVEKGIEVCRFCWTPQGYTAPQLPEINGCYSLEDISRNP